MQSELKVALIQTSLIWENPLDNRNMFSAKDKGDSKRYGYDYHARNVHNRIYHEPGKSKR